MVSPVELRHILHKNPELSFQEYKTTEILEKNISQLGNIKIHKPIETGLIAEYTVNGGDYLLFRGDIDGLPVKEETDWEFKSENSFMHACGHDIHISVLYGFLSEVVKNKINKNILFLFQPAEETGTGAKKIIDTKFLDNYNISKAFALHVTDEYPEGTVASTKGALFASAMEVDVEFFGINSHIAFPHNGKNAFNAMRSYMDIIEKIPVNPVSPFVYGIGKITAGNVRNVVPSYAKCEGSIRSLDCKESERYYEKLKTILEGIKTATGVNYKISQGSFSPEVKVDAVLYEKAKKILSPSYDFIDCSHKMTGEDFSFLSHIYPSFMFWLGTGCGETCGLHNAKFLPKDRVIEKGIDIYMKLLEL